MGPLDQRDVHREVLADVVERHAPEQGVADCPAAERLSVCRSSQVSTAMKTLAPAAKATQARHAF
jgi:hypothetical protein